jgi:hypothetical protein
VVEQQVEILLVLKNQAEQVVQVGVVQIMVVDQEVVVVQDVQYLVHLFYLEDKEIMEAFHQMQHQEVVQVEVEQVLLVATHHQLMVDQEVVV